MMLDTAKRSMEWENKTPATPPLTASTEHVQLLNWRQLTSYGTLGQAADPSGLVGTKKSRMGRAQPYPVQG